MVDETQTAADTEVATPVSQEVVSEAPATAAVQTEPVEQTAKQPDSPIDIETLKREIFGELDARERRLADEMKKARQSFRDTGDSIVQRVREEYDKRSSVINNLEKQGTIGADVALIERARLHDQVESEIIASTRVGEQTQNATPPNNDRSVAEQYVWNETGRILDESGLRQSDPEFALLPRQLPPGDPAEAVDVYRKAVNKAKREKATRLAEEKSKAEARLKSAQSAAVVVDTGASGATKVSTDSLVAEMKRLLSARPASEKERAQNRRRLNEIEEALAKQT